MGYVQHGIKEYMQKSAQSYFGGNTRVARKNNDSNCSMNLTPVTLSWSRIKENLWIAKEIKCNENQQNLQQIS